MSVSTVEAIATNFGLNLDRTLTYQEFVTIDEIANYVKEGRPVMLLVDTGAEYELADGTVYNLPDGSINHIVTIVGCSEDGQTFYITDGGDPENNNISVVSSEELLSQYSIYDDSSSFNNTLIFEQRSEPIKTYTVDTYSHLEETLNEITLDNIETLEYKVGDIIYNTLEEYVSARSKGVMKY